MKRLFVLTVLAGAAGACMANVTLVPTLSAPSELQVGAYEVYTLSVRNTGSVAASGVVIRMNLPAGMVPAGPWPSACSQAGADFQCSPGSIPARRSRDYVITFQAPSATQTFSHRVTATGTGAATAVSAQIATRYQSFDIPVSGSATALWEVRSCNGGTVGVAYNLCPPGSEIVGQAKLHVGGMMEDLLDGMPGSWIQYNPQHLRLDTPAGPGYDAWYAQLKPINSRCFRGAGQSVPTVTGQPAYRTANKICRL